MAKKKKGGWADVIDADGNKVNDKGIKLNQAEALLAELTGEGGETQEPVETPEPAPVEEPKAKAGKLGVKLAEALGAVLIHEDEVSVTLGKNGAQWSCNTQDGYDVALQAFQRVM